jgi:hypothetical protein
MPPKFGGVPAPRSQQQGNQQRNNNGRQQQQQQPNRNVPQPQSQQSQGRHTVVLIQQSPDTTSRTYTDHDSVNEAINSLIGVFEARQIAKSNQGREVSYTTDQLLGFIDSLFDLSMMTYDKQLKAYIPHDKKFIKNKIYLSLSKQQGR